MTKSELIAALAEHLPDLTPAEVDVATRHLLDQLSAALARGERIEVRGFGSFALRYRHPRHGHNPKTGAAVVMRGRHLPHFKPAKEMRGRVNTDDQLK
jgi:integration host factor subunit beta